MSNHAGISKAISFSVVLVGIAVFYYFVVFLPKQEQARFEFQKQEQQLKDANERYLETSLQDEKDQRQKDLQSCLDDADTNYHAAWDKNCKNFEMQPNCTTLPAEVADALIKTHKEAKDFCLKRYPPN